MARAGSVLNDAGNGPRLNLPEDPLAAAGEDIRDGAVAFHNDRVSVHERGAKLLCQLLPDRRFADGHGPDQRYGPVPCARCIAEALASDRIQRRRNAVEVALDVAGGLGHGIAAELFSDGFGQDQGNHGLGNHAGGRNGADV